MGSDFTIAIKKHRTGFTDFAAQKLAESINSACEIKCARCEIAKLYICHKPFHNLPPKALAMLLDPVQTEWVKGVEILREKSEKSHGKNPDPQEFTSGHTIYSRYFKEFGSYILEAKKIGVTDSEGMLAQQALSLSLGIESAEQHVFAQNLYLFDAEMDIGKLQKVTSLFLGNPLIYRFSYGKIEPGVMVFDPTPDLHNLPKVDYLDIGQEIATLMKISDKSLWMFSKDEMLAIKKHFTAPDTLAERKTVGMAKNPTDCEMEVLAQTWSEHCKHKEFAGIIHYSCDGTKKTINSLFQTYIRSATLEVKKNLENWGAHWLVKVFDDNAGLVKINATHMLAWKVETHNSPSALDPYGGALTGIVGVNRDPLGTGIGGAKLIFNTNVLCFGPPDYSAPLPSDLIHPKKIMQGVCKGIEDGGNKSGIPTVNGAVVFHSGFCGKPLVFCGTAGLLPCKVGGKDCAQKNIRVGMGIFMAGGRVGSDGIHGATFSSVQLTEHSPRNAVQIGEPFTQKLLADFLAEALTLELLEASTDNGAGGLASSVGELAQFTGGAKVWLEKVPLKYTGLEPWEIFVSESQERMTLVLEKQNEKKVLALAHKHGVELTLIGEFTSSGFLEVFYNDALICHLNMEFLHKGAPVKVMEAEYIPIAATDFHTSEHIDYNQITLDLLASKNICSREEIIRRYDHEVQGKTILKPLMGLDGSSPQDAAVVRLGFNNWEGLAVSCGLCPKFTKFDAYAASAGAFDEGIRQIISVGGMLPGKDYPETVWSVNDNFCVPDSIYHKETNPDGTHKLGQLVQMCEALYDMSTYFHIPLTSGKDSMKNDYRRGNVKISIPPTVLYSMVAKIPDIRSVVSSAFKTPAAALYLAGKSYFEMAGSEFAALLGSNEGQAPLVRREKAKALYLKMMQAHRLSLLESSHDLSDGGLIIALAESAFGGKIGCKIELDYTTIPLLGEAFGESHSRFLVSVLPQNKERFENIMGEDATYLGTTTTDSKVQVMYNGAPIIDLNLVKMEKAWKAGLTL